MISRTGAPRDVWHYTTAAGLSGILRSQTLWATETAFLNDASEIDYGTELFRQAVTTVLAAGSYADCEFHPRPI